MKKVLIVDDSPVSRVLMKNLVLKRECEVIEACNTVEAIDQFTNENPDIVFMDIIMETSRSGIEVLREIKKKNPKTVVIMVTSIAQQDSVIRECVESGADEYISKPFKDDDILNALDRHLK